MSDHANSLAGVSALIVDNDPFTRNLVVQMLRGFNMQEPAVASNGAAAQAYLTGNAAALCLCEAVLPDMSCNTLIHWIRRHAPAPARTMPVIVLTSHTHLKTVTKARDSGASVIVKKPISAHVLREHIQWAGTSMRSFVNSDGYVGPDRRFRSQPGPLKGGRRQSDRQHPDADTGDDTTAYVGLEIKAIEEVLVTSGDELGFDARRRIMMHGRNIATAAGRGGYAHLEIAARSLCDAAAGLAPRDPRGVGPVTVHLRAMQLLTLAGGAPTTHGADRILDELARMLSHLGICARYADDETLDAGIQ